MSNMESNQFVVSPQTEEVPQAEAPAIENTATTAIENGGQSLEKTGISPEEISVIENFSSQKELANEALLIEANETFQNLKVINMPVQQKIDALFELSAKFRALNAKRQAIEALTLAETFDQIIAGPEAAFSNDRVQKLLMEYGLKGDPSVTKENFMQKLQEYMQAATGPKKKEEALVQKEIPKQEAVIIPLHPEMTPVAQQEEGTVPLYPENGNQEGEISKAA